MGRADTRLALAPTTTQKEIIFMANEKKMDAEVKIRCFLEEKDLLKKSAEETGLSLSDYVRSLIFGKEKLVLISEGTDIAKNLFLIHTDLEYFRNSGGIQEESVEALTNALNDVSTMLNTVASMLSDVHTECSEDNNDE